MVQYRNAFRGSVQSTNLVSPGLFSDQGGGNKKAGLVPLKNAPVMRWVALDVSQTRNTLPNMTGTNGQVIFGLKQTPAGRWHHAQRPIGFARNIPYFSIPGTGLKGVSPPFPIN